ncbi:MAG: stage II sporulation protein P [Candidatus Syntrophonatronum acetioxidans]|uniref:Stage II sporulation protein P n=1 Tax=Candidatus Syntrophonatronum acetioxidans TaxID=1795816 RepID=A0A424Y9V5_9FIRM|nr:MAG: stage II sporulation protein P [Candidatus Syntrophonatronum acetioxidans]
MNKTGKIIICLSVLILVLLWGFFLQVYGEGEILKISSQEELDFFELFNLDERDDGEYYTMVDDEGNTIMKTARHLHQGDSFIGSDDELFEVYKVEDNIAYARQAESAPALSPSLTGLRRGIFNYLPALEFPVIFQREGEEEKTIGILHSHGAESYVPSDGSESIPEGGGILKVGETFASHLEGEGIEVIHSQETHVPHDSGAYLRSRRTAEELLKENPDAIFDVHRDAVPPEEYLAEIEGEERVQITLVVGRQNQNAANNQEFAEGLKKIADERYPNLIRGILMAQGNYNQDLNPRKLLLEVGSHENEREDAEESIGLFAEVASTFLYDTEAGGEQRGALPDSPSGAGGIAFGRVLGLIFLALLAAAAFLLISTGSMEELKAKVKNFAQREFSTQRDDSDRDEGE